MNFPAAVPTGTAAANNEACLTVISYHAAMPAATAPEEEESKR